MENIDKKLEEYKEGYVQIHMIDNLISRIISDKEFINNSESVSIVDTLEQRHKKMIENKK